MRVDCGPVRMRSRRRARRLHGGQRRHGRADHGAAARRARAASRGRRAPRRRLPADELHPRRARGLGAGPRLPPRPARGGPAPRGRHAAPARAASRARSPRARALFAETAGRRPRAGAVDAPGIRARPRRLRPRPRPRRAQRLRRRSAPGRPRPLGGRAAPSLGRSPGRGRGDRAGHEARGGAHVPRRRRAPTSWSAARASLGWPSRASWPAPRRGRSTCSSSTATRSASAPTSACAAPTPWLHAMGVASSIRQELPHMTFATPHGRVRYRLPWCWSAFDYRELCRGAVGAGGDARFETAKVEGRAPARATPATSPSSPTAATLRAPARRRRAGLAARAGRPARPAARRAALARPRGPPARATDPPATRSTSGSSATLVRRGYGWRVPAGGEARIGVGSYEPRHHVQAPTVALAGRLGADAERWQGNWFPHRLRAADRGRRLLRRRQRRPLLPALRRGHPHRVLLRRSPAGASCARVLAGDADRARGAGALRGLPRRARARVPPRAAPPAPRSRRCRRAC